jgi:hypothetical protein
VPDDIEHATLRYSLDGGETFHEAELAEYPFEVTVHVDSPTEFEVEYETADGTECATSDTGILRPAE